MKVYDSLGVLLSTDSSVQLLAGSCVGGGTMVNWCGSLATPEHVLQVPAAPLITAPFC